MNKLIKGTKLIGVAVYPKSVEIRKIYHLNEILDQTKPTIKTCPLLNGYNTTGNSWKIVAILENC